MPPFNTIIQGDCLAVLKTWPDAFVNCVVTSPPYWGLRDYGVAGQIGMENTLKEYVAKIVETFREVRRVLKDDGTAWLNIGDSYASNSKGSGGPSDKQDSNREPRFESKKINHGLKPKDLVGIPWCCALALRADGWYLRSDIIWSKPNSMPESVTDRPTRSHEYIFLLSKSAKYYYDSDAIKEKAIYYDIAGMDETGFKNPGMFNGKHAIKALPETQAKLGVKRDKQRGHGRRDDGLNDRWDGMAKSEQCSGMRNKRTVWEVSPSQFSELHFATFPTALISPCILAGSQPGGLILDPFMGAGTTALVAARYSRHFLGIEINPDYIKIAEKRVSAEVRQVKLL